MPYQSELTYLLVALPSNQTYIKAHRDVVERVRCITQTPKHRVTRPHVTLKEWSGVTHIGALMQCIESSLDNLAPFKMTRTAVHYFPEKNAIYVGFEDQELHFAAFKPLWKNLTERCVFKNYSARETKKRGPTPHMTIIFNKDYEPHQFDALYRTARKFPLDGPEEIWFHQLALFSKDATGHTERLATYNL